MTIHVHSAAAAFGQELQDLLDGVLPRPWNVDERDRQVQVVVGARGRYVVRVAAQNGAVVLIRNGAHVAHLRVEFRCTHDTAGSYLAVQKSTFELLSASDRVPLLRLDYDRGAHTVPACHWNVHAERGAVSNLLGRTNPDHPGLVSKLHLPVGGPRMRPCLEDFIDMCAYEFRFDLRANATRALEDGRERWRRRQAATIVRDAPDEAVRVLTSLGYIVAAPRSGPAPSNLEALRSR